MKVASCHADRRHYARGLCRLCYQKAHRKAGPSRWQWPETKRREYQLRTRHGLSVEEYEKLLASQGGRCAICRRLPGKQRLAVDHDHNTGKIRGLLCSTCNRKIVGIIERFGVDPEAIVVYLLRK